MKTQTTIRVDESSYNKAKEILNDLGLNYSQANWCIKSLELVPKFNLIIKSMNISNFFKV